MSFTIECLDCVGHNMIQKKYKKLSNNTIAEYRKFVTPFFYIRLKTRVYCYKERSISLFDFLSDPRGSYCFAYTEWTINKKSIYDKSLINILTLENTRKGDNVLKFTGHKKYEG